MYTAQLSGTPLWFAGFVSATLRSLFSLICLHGVTSYHDQYFVLACDVLLQDSGARSQQSLQQESEDAMNIDTGSVEASDTVVPDMNQECKSDRCQVRWPDT